MERPDLKTVDTEDFGCDIAAKLSWNGKYICETFLAALTDANFHSLKKELEFIINREFEQ